VFVRWQVSFWYTAYMHKYFGGISAVFVTALFATAPTSTNYTLKSYDIGTGGGSSSSTSYRLNGVSGTQNGAKSTSTNYGTQPGTTPTVNANVPPAPTLTNPSSYTDKLQLVLAAGSNPSDTKFAIAISPDSFSTITRYVKADHSIGTTLTAADYQTYSAWGGASGFLILGLTGSTVYTVKVKAMQGDFSETAYGPTATAATAGAMLTFGLTTTLTSTPPFAMSFASLAPGSVFNADADATLSLTTNANLGGSIYIKDSNNGLLSSTAAYTLSSTSTDLTSGARGYGAIVTAASQSSGGPIAASAPYNGTGNNVGVISSSLRELANTSAAVTGASLTVRLKAKTDITVPSSSDYADTLTFVAAMQF
jgi:hypothetical protein